jgi:hypothetical protein
VHLRTSGLSTLNKDQIAERGARMGRRDDRTDREYLRKEQQRQAGCPARGQPTSAAAKCARVLALAALLCPAALAAAASRFAPAAPQPTPAEIARGLETVKADPNLTPVRTVKMLRWRGSGAPREARVPGWLAWIGDLFRWLDQTARVLVWGVALTLIAALLVYLARRVRSGADQLAHQMSAAPVRINDLDIRPESLPDDIGGAARRLWDRSDHRAALALLYRGMLSRLVHVHQIPIRDSMTEVDCLVLAAAHLEPASSEYSRRLVTVWQRAVYGREHIQPFDVYGLCDGFRAALDSATPVLPASGA